eukprot:GHRR01013375.1.p1 GENE.GHRR01013375.1~~GHRR01013375.1.p1  ORF type:complete len:459 (+),score=289.76 GHRR01013375.1:702-2078(+)
MQDPSWSRLLSTTHHTGTAAATQGVYSLAATAGTGSPNWPASNAWSISAGNAYPLSPTAAAGHAAVSTVLEDRLAVAEGRALAAEQAAMQAARAADMAGSRVISMTADLAHTVADVKTIKGRYEAAISHNEHLQQQLVALSSELHQLQLTAAGAKASASESSIAGGQLRQQLAAVSEQMARLETERAADRAQLQALQSKQQQQLAALQAQQQQQQLTLAAAQQQQAVAAAAESAAVRQGAAGLAGELGSRQAALLRDMAALAVEIEGYRQEAAAAGTSLHTNIERLNAKLATESTAIGVLRQGAATAARQEAAALAGLQGQIQELAASLSLSQQQLSAAEAGRRADAAAAEARMKHLQQQLAEAEAGMMKRMTGLLEARAADVAAALNSVDQRSSDRDETNRRAVDASLSAVVSASLSSEAAAKERMATLEGGLARLAAAAAQAQAALADAVSQGGSA